MSIIKYKTNSSKTRVEVVEVTRESASSVWLGTCRHAKTTSYECYFDTFEAAFDACMTAAQSNVDAARRRLEFCNGLLGSIKGMKRPEPKAKP